MYYSFPTIDVSDNEGHRPLHHKPLFNVMPSPLWSMYFRVTLFSFLITLIIRRVSWNLQKYGKSLLLLLWNTCWLLTLRMTHRKANTFPLVPIIVYVYPGRNNKYTLFTLNAATLKSSLPRFQRSLTCMWHFEGILLIEVGLTSE